MITPNERLETARMHKRWSVMVASEKVGVSVNTFNRWERGLQVPQLSTLDMVCKAFDMSPEDLGFGHAIRAKRRIQKQHDAPLAEPVTSSVYPSVPLIQSTVGIQDVMKTVQQPIDALSAGQTGKGFEYLGQAHDIKDGSDEDMVDKEFSRRRVISTLIGAPVTILGLVQGGHTKLLHPEEILSLCEVSIPLSWRLYFEGGLDEVNQTLPGYLTQLTNLAQEPSHYQKRAVGLASQGYQLASLLATQHQNFGTAATYAAQAFTLAEQIGDAHLQTASLIRQALVYFYLKRPQQRLQTYERALHYSHKTSALLQGRVHIGLSEVYSKLGLEQEAGHHLELAYKTFPERCEEDPGFPYTHFSLRSLSSLEGVMHLNLGCPRRAWENFTQMDRQLPKTLVPDRLQLTVRQAMATYELDDRDQSCDYVEAAARSSLQVGNQLRYDEAYNVYEQIQQKWSKENRVKELRTLFS